MKRMGGGRGSECMGGVERKGWQLQIESIHVQAKDKKQHQNRKKNNLDPTSAKDELTQPAAMIHSNPCTNAFSTVDKELLLTACL